MQGDACESLILSFQTENDIFACVRVINSMETLQYHIGMSIIIIGMSI